MNYNLVFSICMIAAFGIDLTYSKTCQCVSTSSVCSCMPQVLQPVVPAPVTCGCVQAAPLPPKPEYLPVITPIAPACAPLPTPVVSKPIYFETVKSELPSLPLPPLAADCAQEAIFRSTSSGNCACSKLVNAPDDSGSVYFPKNKKLKMSPLDAVSLGLAYRAAYRPRVLESQIAYGFKQRPIDQPKLKKLLNNIPEEGLCAMDSSVIEFKPIKYAAESCEEDMDTDDEEEEDLSDEHCYEPATSGLSYSDIGFVPSKAKDGKFVRLPVTAAVRSATECGCKKHLYEHHARNSGIHLGDALSRNHYNRQLHYRTNSYFLPDSSEYSD